MSEATCHALPSVANPAELAAKLLESWDIAAALSRASLRRRIATILRGSVPVSGTSGVSASTLSRATLGP